ncbi:MAG: aconitase family protein, partial [Planctomycetes bacterium]|nr:aconitase family protein [Planctomycetota bacterium]
VSFDINPTSRQVLINLMHHKHLTVLIESGGRLHQAGCNGCIGMGQAPATNKISLRTVPRNFPGRSGTREDQVYLVSPETATASALTGRITDPRTMDMAYPRIADPDSPVIQCETLLPPAARDETVGVVELEKGPNIVSLPDFDALPDSLSLPILLHVRDDISTDEIMPAGARILPLRSNIPEISKFCFEMIDPDYPQRALKTREDGGHAIVGGDNYGQGSSREHAALAPRFLGLRLVLANSFARIHRQNLVNFGVLPLTFLDRDMYQRLQQGDVLQLNDLRSQLRDRSAIRLRCEDNEFEAEHGLSPRQIQVLLAGGLINWAKDQMKVAASSHQRDAD